jgi:hypothetical protein
MPRYFMNLRDGTSELLDPDGQEFATLNALRRCVLATARDLMVGEIRDGIIDLRFRIDAEDEWGVIVYSLEFKDAVRIIPQAATVVAVCTEPAQRPAATVPPRAVPDWARAEAEERRRRQAAEELADHQRNAKPPLPPQDR